MNIFKRENKVLPPLWAEGELAEMSVNYDSVLEYLQGLSDKDYATITKIAGIYRKANDDAAKALGTQFEPSAFIMPPTEIDTHSGLADQYADKVANPNGKTMLDDDDDISAAFLDDEPKAPNKIKTRKVKVKS